MLVHVSGGLLVAALMSSCTRGERVVLLNPGMFADSSLRLPPALPLGTSAVAPVQTLMDLDESGRAVGMAAVYGPDADIERVARAIDDRYARWRIGNLYLWRVEDERVALHLVEEAGWVNVLYLPFIDTPPLRRSVSGPCWCRDYPEPPDTSGGKP